MCRLFRRWFGLLRGLCGMLCSFVLVVGFVVVVFGLFVVLLWLVRGCVGRRLCIVGLFRC